MKTKIISLFIIGFVIISHVCADTARSASPSQQKQKETQFSASEIIAKIDEIYETLKKEDLKENPLYPTQFTSYRSILESYANYSKIEKETKIHKDWFLKLVKIMKAMEPFRINLKLATMNKDREQYLKSKQEYDKCFSAFEEAYQNPIKIRGR